MEFKKNYGSTCPAAALESKRPYNDDFRALN